MIFNKEPKPTHATDQHGENRALVYALDWFAYGLMILLMLACVLLAATLMKQNKAIWQMHERIERLELSK